MRHTRTGRAIGRRGRMRTAAGAALWLLAAGTWPGLAGEAEAPPAEATSEPATGEEVERTEAPPRIPAPPETDAETPAVFVPSEDISEDLSVRFPVDI